MTNTITIRLCKGASEYAKLVKIWQSAVSANFDFLTPDDIEFYRERVAEFYLPSVALTVAELDGTVCGFAGLTDAKLEMLYVDDAFRGRGVGSALLQDALTREPHLTLSVNEQNEGAHAFYEHHGFIVDGRSELDADERPFPMLHMRLGAGATS